MKVLVTGASGFVGGHVCRSLIAKGHIVTAVVRDLGRTPAGALGELIPAINGDTDWGATLKGHDVIIHLAARVHVMSDESDSPLAEFRAVNTDGTKRLAEAAVSAGVPRFIFLSSIKVNGESTTGVPFTADDSPAPVDPYGVSKHEAENALSEIAGAQALTVIIIRTPLVYGPGVGGNFLKMLKLAKSGLPLPLGAVRNARTMSSVWNLVDLIERSIEVRETGIKVVLAGDSSSVSTPEMFRVLSRAMNKRSILVKVPSRLLVLAGRVMGKAAEIDRLTGSLEVAAGAGAESWAWRPPIGVEDGLAATAVWFDELTPPGREGSK